MSIDDLESAYGYGGSREKVMEAIRSLDPGETGPHGRTAMHVAAENVDPEAMEALISNGFRAGIADEYGRTPLHILAVQRWEGRTSKMAECTDILLANRCPPNRRDDSGRCFYHIAADMHNLPMISIIGQRLIRCDSALESSGMNALHLLCESGNRYDRLRESDPEGFGAKDEMCRRMAEWLIGCGIDPEAETRIGRKAVDFAIENGLGKTASLLRGDAEGFVRGMDLYQATITDDAPAVSELLSKGTDPDEFWDRDGDYKVVSITRRGQKISPTTGTHGINSAVNGFYYPIDGILLYDDEVKNTALRGRLRFDISTMTPEIWTANLRGRTTRFFTDDFFENIINVAEDTRLFYLSNPGSAWYDYQGDEFEVTGVFDVTFRLPPVPTAGTYEVRMGISNNTLRGMAQIYFGDNPQNLAPTGLPIDLRVCARGGGDINDYKEELPDIFAVIPWETDVEDEEQNRTVEKNLRNAGYMKGPKYFHGHAWTYPARENNACLRRIITQQYMTPDKTYYIRYKTALEATDTQFFTDYFELCPSYIYNGPEPEDVW